MGLLSFGKDRAQAKALVPQWLKTANDCANIVNKTTNPEIFFNRYELMLEMMDNLIWAEQYVNFKRIKPHVQKEELLAEQENQTRIFIERAYQKAREEAAEKTTEKGQRAYIFRFFEKLENYYQKMTRYNIEYIESLKKIAIDGSQP